MWYFAIASSINRESEAVCNGRQCLGSTKPPMLWFQMVQVRLLSTTKTPSLHIYILCPRTWRPAYVKLCEAPKSNASFHGASFFFVLRKNAWKWWTITKPYYCCLTVWRMFFLKLHRSGIEPGPPAWQASILPLNHRCENDLVQVGLFSQSYFITYLILFSARLNHICQTSKEKQKHLVSTQAHSGSESSSFERAFSS